MSQFAIIWDLETVPDLAAVARANSFDEHDEQAAIALLGDKFPKLPFHSIVCIGALIAERVDDHWCVRSFGAPHIGERTEAELIAGFVERIGSLLPKLVSFNGHGFDLPVLRYRAMVSAIPAPGLAARPYFNRYDDSAVDLCDVLASFDARSKMSLDELCRVLGLPGKPEDIDGSEVWEYVKAGRIEEVSRYCVTDLINTYRLWLRYELFRGALTQAGFEGSEADLLGFIQARIVERPHLKFMIPESAVVEES